MENKPVISHPQMDSELNASLGIDFEKIVSIIRKSWIWVLLIFLIANGVAYLSIRWTKPLYKSSSELKLDFKSEASSLGLGNLMDNSNINHLSGEIELLSSKLFFNKVIEAANIDVTYLNRGNILNDERYKHTPFKVKYEVKSGLIFDKEIDVDFSNKKDFELSYIVGDEKFTTLQKFGVPFETNEFKMTIEKTGHYGGDNGEDFFFVIRSHDALIKYFENNYEVQPLNFQANTIRLTLQDNNPYKAKELVELIDSIYLVYSQEQKSVENDRKIAWLNNEMKQIEENLEGYEDYFEAFTIKNRTNDLDKVLVETIKAIQGIDSQKYELKRRLDNLSELIAQAEEKQTNSTMISFNPELLTADLEEGFDKYNALQLDFNRISKSYSKETFTYKNKQEQLSSSKQFLLSQLKEKQGLWNRQYAKLSNSKVQLEKSFNDIPAKDRAYKKAQLYYTLYEDHYLALMGGRTNFEIAKAGTKNDIIVLSPASLPRVPIAPDKLIIHGIGLVAALVFSLFFISIRYLLSNTITNLGELEKLTDSTILGAIPKFTGPKLASTKLIIDSTSRSTISEALRTIRTNLEFVSGGKKNKIISVTSTVGSEGKTFVSVNLGGVIALSKRSVVIVDLDMRKPRIHDAFHHDRKEKGVSTILIGKHSIDECIIKTDIPTLDYISAGPTPPNPSELLLNGEFDNLIKSLSERYDHVILDTPPASIVTDAILVMKKVDLPIYVVRADYSKKSFIKTLNRLKYVNKFDNIAVIMNSLQTTGSKKYGYGYYIDE